MSEPSDWRKRRVAERAARGLTAEQEAAELSRLEADARHWHDALQWARRRLADVDNGKIRIDNVPGPGRVLVAAFERAARIFMLELDASAAADHELFMETHRDLVEPLLAEVLRERKAKRERGRRGGSAPRTPTSLATLLAIAVFATRKRLRDEPFEKFVDVIQPGVRFGEFEIEASTLHRERTSAVEQDRKRTRTRWGGDVTLATPTTHQPGSCVVTARALYDAWGRARRASGRK